MLSKSNASLIRSLKTKKYRAKYGLFLAEGQKLVRELLTSGFRSVHIFASSEAAVSVEAEIGAVEGLEIISDREMASVSQLKTPPGLLAVFELPEYRLNQLKTSARLLVLDELRDPGNLGSMIRTADWFGYGGILCSEGCVDAWNPKVVQASMGSIARIPLIYGELTEFSRELDGHEWIGSRLAGEPLSGFGWPERFALVIGSESHGMRGETAALCNKHLRIPGGQSTESLNAAIAAGILMHDSSHS